MYSRDTWYPLEWNPAQSTSLRSQANGHAERSNLSVALRTEFQDIKGSTE